MQKTYRFYEHNRNGNAMRLPIPFANVVNELISLISPYPPPLEKPKVIQFPVNDVCNSRCQMCLIWERKKDVQILAEQLRRGLRNPLFSDVRSVGINGGEPTLRKDLAALVEVLFSELPSLRNISLITNAINASAVCTRINEIGAVIQRCAGHLDVMVSLDGYGDVHDRVRGKPGNFAAAQQVIAHAKASPLVGSLRVGCTIIRENALHLAELLEYCITEGVYVKFRLGVPHQRLYTANVRPPFALDESERHEVAQFLGSLIRHYETRENQIFFYRSLLGQLTTGAPRQAGCDWQFRGATISARGELLYCAIQSDVLLDDIAQGDANTAYFHNKKHLHDIIATKCAHCAHDYVGPLPKAVLRRKLIQRIVRRIDPWDLRKVVIENPRIRRAAAERRFQRRCSLFEGHAASASSATRTTTPNQRADRSVIICGWYGTETLGDKAILAAVVEVIRATLGASTEIAVVSLYPYLTRVTQLQMIDLAGVSVIGLDEAFARTANGDYLVFGGGPLMAIDNMAEMLSLFQTAKRCGTTTVIAGCGVGPFGRQAQTRSIADLLRLSDHRIYRDERSRELAQELGIASDADSVAEDPAFTWIERAQTELVDSAPSRRPTLLMGLREFPAAQYAPDHSTAQRQAIAQAYEAAVIDGLELLVAQHPDILLRPLPMCTNQYGGDDRWFYRRIFRGRTALMAALDTSLLGAELPPLDYLNAFKSATAVLAMRFHSLVFALATRRPAVAIDYTLRRGKVYALATKYAVPHASVAELNADRLAEQLALIMTAEPRTASPSLTFASKLGRVLCG
jgi:polysaccharide pyruvyl transferase WcaK-like protein/molybdenum cofactor biosynthesis enzyme MoaA